MVGVSLILVTALLAGAQSLTKPPQAVQNGTTVPKAGGRITVPAGTKIELALMRPVWAYSASRGTPFYAITTFPVVTNGHVAIPPGTYIQGTIQEVIRPARRKDRAEIQILFTKIIYANGYAMKFPGSISTVNLSGNSAGESATQTPADGPAPAGELAPTLIEVSVQVSASSDVLLDNGSAIEMTLGAPLMPDAAQVSADIPISRAPVPGQFVSASRCRPTPGIPGTPGTPGTPDSVIPGSPGTPSTVIPGGPGEPDTVIPGTPATPDTVIPGTPGTPGTPDIPGRVCPYPPVVISCTPVNAAGNTGHNSPRNERQR